MIDQVLCTQCILSIKCNISLWIYIESESKSNGAKKPESAQKDDAKKKHKKN